MSYGVYFKYDGERYKLPVNPEEIKKTQKLKNTRFLALARSVFLPMQICGNTALNVNCHIQKSITWNRVVLQIQTVISRC